MVVDRQRLLGAPHIYYLTLQTALDQPVFTEEAERDDFLELLELVRTVFAAQLFGWRLDSAQIHLALRLDPRIRDPEARLDLLGSRNHPSHERLQQRLGSIGSLMQCLGQRFAHRSHARHGSRGHFWAGRYRNCLLADDAALLASIAWLERPGAASSACHRGGDRPPRLSRLPLRVLPGGLAVPADEAQLGFPPPAPTDEHQAFQAFCQELDEDSLRSYGQALTRGWALGRPESLTESLDRLGRSSGRGRSRQIRELEDWQGLCGLWG